MERRGVFDGEPEEVLMDWGDVVSDEGVSGLQSESEQSLMREWAVSNLRVSHLWWGSKRSIQQRKAVEMYFSTRWAMLFSTKAVNVRGWKYGEVYGEGVVVHGFGEGILGWWVFQIFCGKKHASSAIFSHSITLKKNYALQCRLHHTGLIKPGNMLTLLWNVLGLRSELSWARYQETLGTNGVS